MTILSSILTRPFGSNTSATNSLYVSINRNRSSALHKWISTQSHSNVEHLPLYLYCTCPALGFSFARRTSYKPAMSNFVIVINIRILSNDPISTQLTVHCFAFCREIAKIKIKIMSEWGDSPVLLLTNKFWSCCNVFIVSAHSNIAKYWKSSYDCPGWACNNRIVWLP